MDYLTVNDEIDPFILSPVLPFSGIGYHVLDEGITARICRTFNLFRLQHIKQLGFLHQPLIGTEDPGIITQEFPHNRFMHVLDVRAVAKIILANNSCSETDHLLNDIVTLSHDALTPAGGDSTKAVDPQRFDEDAHYPELLRTIDWSLLPEIQEEHKSALPDIIMNKGKLGMVLDIADKVAYLSRDVRAYFAPGLELNGHKEVRQSLEAAPLFSSVWETVCIDKEKVFFTDKDRLIKLLEIRSLMFKHLYLNPASRFWEQFVKMFVLERLYKTHKLTAEQLCTIVDWQLHQIIEQEIGESFLQHFVGQSKERRESFDTLPQAEKRKQELIRQGRVICIIEKSFICKTGDHFLVETKNGLKPLFEADPDASDYLKFLIKPDKLFNIYYIDLPLDHIPSSLRNWK